MKDTLSTVSYSKSPICILHAEVQSAVKLKSKKIFLESEEHEIQEYRFF